MPRDAVSRTANVGTVGTNGLNLTVENRAGTVVLVVNIRGPGEGVLQTLLYHIAFMWELYSN